MWKTEENKAPRDLTMARELSLVITVTPLHHGPQKANRRKWSLALMTLISLHFIGTAFALSPSIKPTIDGLLAAGTLDTLNATSPPLGLNDYRSTEISSNDSDFATTNSSSSCRDTFGMFPRALFKRWTCGMCFTFLYNSRATDIFFDNTHLVMVIVNSTHHPVAVVYPDADNATHAQKICGAVKKMGEDCQRWKDCCKAAEDCCDRQIALGNSVLRGTKTHGGILQTGGEDVRTSTVAALYCPRTWDGYRCWDDTSAGSTVTQKCPAYIEHSSNEAKASKYCQGNGTWYTNPLSKKEWTDFSSCVDFDNLMVLFWVGILCNALSLILLIPACFIFLYFRTLRQQHRIKLHVCLFSSYIFTNILMMLWESIIHKSQLHSDMETSIVQQNNIGCRILYALTRYAWMANFLWMWLEGFHLFRLMVHAFAVPRSLLGFYIGGFAAPLVPTIIYSTIRAVKPELNTRCWVRNAGDFEWIIHVPIIFCVGGNLLFLGKILWVMVSQLTLHPNEPSNYRRAVKAAAILIPLFGLQALLVIIQPGVLNFTFEIISKTITNTQGAAVALGFCYLNGEVLSMIKNALPQSLRSRGWLRSDAASTISTQFTTDTSSRPIYHPPASLSRTGSGLDGIGTGNSIHGKRDSGYIPLSTFADDSVVKARSDGTTLRNGTTSH